MSSVSLPWDEQAGQPENVVHVMDNDKVLRDKFNGNLDADNLSAAIRALLAQAGLTYDTNIRRGKSVIATAEATTNTSYALLATPDQVSNITLPTDGLIAVAYQALWKKASAGDLGDAAIFLGANQARGANVGTSGSAPVQQAELGTTDANIYHPLASCGAGLLGSGTNMGADAAGVTTGQIVGSKAANWGTLITNGGPCYIFAAAGTYNVSVQFKSGAGNAVTVKERKLWVWTLGF